MAGPLEQFNIKVIQPITIGGFDVSFTNSAAYMVATFFAIVLFLSLGTRKAALVPSRWQVMVEMTYDFIAKMLHDITGDGGRKYFPFIFSLFMFILMANLIGMIPYQFTITSHIAVTFALAFFIFIGVTIIGFATHGLKFFKMFCPDGVPVILMPLLIPIEVVSYLSRPISLSVRLFANMTAGHATLKVFGTFVVGLSALSGIGVLSAVLPLTMIIGLTALEFLVACLQAYIFAVLTCIYLNDALHMH